MENSALSKRCSHCGKVFSRPDAETKFNPEDAGTLFGAEDKPKDSGASRPATGGGGTKGSGGTRLQSDAWKDSQVLSKTPSGIGGNDMFLQGDMEAGTLYGANDPSPSLSSSRSGGGMRGAFTMGGSLEAGMDFGPRFHIEQLLGEGGMGKVFKAYDKELGRTVALKILLPELTKDPSVILRFKQELLLASKISHRNVLRIHDLSEYEGVKFITMAFIEGKDLNQILKEEKPLPLNRAMKIARQLCEALDAAHAEGVVHRDFKPHNVLMSSADQVYVSDFGLATSLETAKMGMTRTGAFVGTPRYMSPEQVEGKPVDSRSDLYSLGLVLYEMVAGEVPFAGESTWQVMYQRVKETPKDVQVVNPKVPENISKIIMHCLEREPSERYQTAKEILADIDEQHAPEMSVSSMYRRPTAMASSTSAVSTTSRTVQITLPEGSTRWLYVALASLAVIVLFFAIPQTRQLVIKPPAESGSAAEVVQGLPPLTQGKYIAVLPFRLLGDPGSLGYVAEGLGEAVSAKLFQLQEVHVASSADAPKDETKMPLPQIAKRLGANMIVHGVVQGNASQLRITVKLENVVENRTVWSDEFSGVPGDLLTIEDKIYAKLADALETKGVVAEAGGAHPTDNVDAYDAYLRGRNAMRGDVNPKTIQAAIDYFNTALKKDPNFALAYTGLADASLRMYVENKESFWTDKALGAAKQAQRLNDKLPEVHSSLGSVYAATGQNTQAIAELKRALELAPNSDEGYRRLGNAYLQAGQKDWAIRSLEKAAELNPYYWVNVNALATAYEKTGDFEKSLKLFQQVTQLEPQNAIGFLNLGAVYVQLGRYEESIAPLETATKLEPRADVLSNLGTSYFFLKRYKESVAQFEKAVQLAPGDATMAGNLADAYRGAGQRDQARATYDKAIALSFKELQVNPRDAAMMGTIALYMAKKGDPGQATEYLQRARGINPALVDLNYDAAVVHTIGNRQADAISDLKKAMQQGYPAESIDSDPEFDSLHGNTEYQALIAQFKAKKK